MPEQFWMVYGIGKKSPTYRHDSLNSALAEAKRLARENPGLTFVVLEAVGAIVKREFDTISYRADRSEVISFPATDNIPF